LFYNTFSYIYKCALYKSLLLNILYLYKHIYNSEKKFLMQYPFFIKHNQT